MRVWAQLRHENVVGLLGHTQEPEGPGFVSMLYPHGNVLSFLAKNPRVNREIIVCLHPYAFTLTSGSSPTDLDPYSVPMSRWGYNTCMNTTLQLYTAI
jgi:hypothetical protein